jgi:hypothetical protein
MPKLHYGGETYNVADSVKGSDLTAAEGTIMVRTKSGGFLWLATGPGIPMALELPPVGEDGEPKHGIQIF